MFQMDNAGNVKVIGVVDHDVKVEVENLKRVPGPGWQQALQRGEEVRYRYRIDGTAVIEGFFGTPVREKRIFAVGYELDAERDEAGNFALTGLEKLSPVLDEFGNPVTDANGEMVVGIVPHPCVSPIAARPKVNSEGRLTMEAVPLGDGTPVPPECIEVLINRDHGLALLLRGVKLVPRTQEVGVPGSLGRTERMTVTNRHGLQIVNLWAQEYEVVEASRRARASAGFAPTCRGDFTSRIPESKKQGFEDSAEPGESQSGIKM